ncbi:MAG: zinc transporter ZupT [Christensenellales bacterium]
MFTPEAVRAIILAVIAGMSTLLGTLIVFFVKTKSEKLISICLGFASGVMISVSLTDLLPVAEKFLSSYAGKIIGVALWVVFLIIGVLMAAGLDKLVPHEDSAENGGNKKHKNLFRLGSISMLAITLHNFPEGIATFMAGFHDLTLGISVAIAIIMHNIPEGITVALPIYCATGSKKTAFKYTFLSGIAEPIGAVAAFLLLQPLMSDLMIGILFSIISGVMLYIALEELFPSSRQYGYTRLALIATFAGICLMPLTNAI